MRESAWDMLYENRALLCLAIKAQNRLIGLQGNRFSYCLRLSDEHQYPKRKRLADRYSSFSSVATQRRCKNRQVEKKWKDFAKNGLLNVLYQEVVTLHTERFSKNQALRGYRRADDKDRFFQREWR